MAFKLSKYEDISSELLFERTKKHEKDECTKYLQIYSCFNATQICKISKFYLMLLKKRKIISNNVRLYTLHFVCNNFSQMTERQVRLIGVSHWNWSTRISYECARYNKARETTELKKKQLRLRGVRSRDYVTTVSSWKINVHVILFGIKSMAKLSIPFLV